MMPRVLVVSDDPVHVGLIEQAMRRDGREVRSEPTLERGLVAAREWRPQLMLVDLSLGMTSGSLGALLRDQAVSGGIGVIAITETEQLRIVGPGVPVDDVLIPPLGIEELSLRVSRALWERTGADSGSLLMRGGLVIDQERYTVSVDGAVVDLTYKEYELLRFLASNAGKAFTREALLNQVWGYDYYGGSRTVDVHVRRIRAKIEARTQYIDTVRNVGYRFVDSRGPGSEPAEGLA